jgi:hypothetical protein
MGCQNSSPREQRRSGSRPEKISSSKSNGLMIRLIGSPITTGCGGPRLRGIGPRDYPRGCWVPDILGFTLYLASRPNNGMRRQATTGPIDHRQQALVFRKPSHWPRALERLPGRAVGQKGPRRRFRGPLWPCGNHRQAGRGAGPARLPGQPNTVGFGQKRSQGPQAGQAVFLLARHAASVLDLEISRDVRRVGLRLGNLNISSP